MSDDVERQANELLAEQARWEEMSWQERYEDERLRHDETAAQLKTAAITAWNARALLAASRSSNDEIAQADDEGLTVAYMAGFARARDSADEFIEEMRAALEPFASVVRNIPEDQPDGATTMITAKADPIRFPGGVLFDRRIISFDILTFGHFRHARAALSKLKGGGDG